MKYFIYLCSILSSIQKFILLFEPINVEYETVERIKYLVKDS
jgi:hypothetical protein